MSARLVIASLAAVIITAVISAALTLLLTRDIATDALTAAAVPEPPVTPALHVETTMTSDAIESAYAAVQAFKQQDTPRICTQISPLAKRCG